jgi:hypothetical protein
LYLWNSLGIIDVISSFKSGRNQQWIHLVLSFLFLGESLLLLQSHCSLLIHLSDLNHLDSILIGFMCLQTYPFLPGNNLQEYKF